MAKIVKDSGSEKWLTPPWRKNTFPILRQPARSSKDVIGAAFLLHYQGVPYIVSAKHVIEIKNPVIAFSKNDRTVIGIPSIAIEEVGLRWIEHPKGLDLTAIPFHLPLSIIKELDLKSIPEKAWITQPKYEIGYEVSHLGYPEKGTTNYMDGTPSAFPQGMPGKIIDIREPYIEMETAGAHGASGGPVFLKQEGEDPALIGIAIEVQKFGKPTRPHQGIYLNKTTALMISPVKDILESEEMKKQYKNRKFDETWF